jgi:SAM-dependent methyltransferase
MIMKRRSRTIAGIVGFWVIMCLLSVAGAQQQQKVAEQILDETGIRGGLVVHIGCGDGKLTAALCANDSYLAHGLDTDVENIEKARKHIKKLNLYGKVSVDQLNGGSLPYVDNLVNLVVSEHLGGISMEEVMRVLAPNGVACIKKGGRWTKTVKPWPKEIDEWTHYFHDADGNPVAQDSVVGPPERLQWVGGPLWSRHHDHMASMTSMVSARGRLFYILDEGPTASIQLPPRCIQRYHSMGTRYRPMEQPSVSAKKRPGSSAPPSCGRG